MLEAFLLTLSVARVAAAAAPFRVERNGYMHRD
jgi:hypothetical protein